MPSPRACHQTVPTARGLHSDHWDVILAISFPLLRQSLAQFSNKVLIPPPRSCSNVSPFLTKSLHLSLSKVS